MPTSVRVIAVCGVTANVLSALAGYLNQPILLGISSTIMAAGNVYVMIKG